MILLWRLYLKVSRAFFFHLYIFAIQYNCFSLVIPAGNNSTSRAGNSSELIKYLDVKSDNNITSPWNSNQTNSRENLTIIQAGNRRTPATVLKTDVFKLWRGKNDLEPLGGGGTLNSIELPILGVGGQKLYTPVENQKSKESHSTLDDGLAGCSGGGNLATLLDLLDTNLMNNVLFYIKLIFTSGLFFADLHKPGLSRFKRRLQFFRSWTKRRCLFASSSLVWRALSDFCLEDCC
jgi:hypothetical protein